MSVIESTISFKESSAERLNSRLPRLVRAPRPLRHTLALELKASKDKEEVLGKKLLEVEGKDERAKVANEQIREARDRMNEELGEIRDQKKQIELRDGELSRITNALKDREDKLLEAENRLVVRTQEVKQLAESSAQLKLKLEEKMSTNERVCAQRIAEMQAKVGREGAEARRQMKLETEQTRNQLRIDTELARKETASERNAMMHEITKDSSLM